MIVYVRDVVFRREVSPYKSYSVGNSVGRTSGRDLVEMKFTLTMDDEAVGCVCDEIDKGNGANLLIALGRGLAEQLGAEFNVRTKVVVKEVQLPAPTYTAAELQRMLDKALAAERAKARKGAKAPAVFRELDLDEPEDERDLRED